MNLYMYSEFSKEVTNITLKDGCYPCIGYQVSDQLEPAVWFKVLVLDAISIDCNKRVVLWHTSTDLQSLKPEDESQNDEDLPLGTVDEGSDDLESSTNHDDLERKISDVTLTDNTADVLDDAQNVEVNSHQNESVPTKKVQRSSSRRVMHRRISESVYAGGECMGYSGDMDEVFEFAHCILSQLANGEISQACFNKEVFRLLHVHVLPNIHLSADDVLNVQDALAIVSSYLDDIDSLIVEKQALIDSVHRDMKKQRFKFVSDMCQPDFNCTTYSLPFACLVFRQLSDDISKAHDELEDLTQKVEAAKESLMNSGEIQPSFDGSYSGEDNELSRLRSERDQFVMENFNNLLTSRAILEEYTSCFRGIDNQDRRGSKGSKILNSTKKSKSKVEKEMEKDKKRNKSRKSRKSYSPEDEQNALHATYMGMDQTCDSILPDVLALADRKVLLLSVKETMRGVLETLLSGKETSGVDIAPAGTRRPTDVLRHSQIPIEWLSLPEQVSSVLQNNKLDVTQSHLAFCDAVREKCLKALNTRKLSIISNSIMQESSPPDVSPTENGGIYAENKLYGMLHAGTSERSSGISSSMSDTNSNQDQNLTNSCIRSTSLSSSCELLSQNQDCSRQHLSQSDSMSSSRFEDSFNRESFSPCVSNTTSMHSSKFEDSQKFEDSVDSNLNVLSLDNVDVAFPDKNSDEVEQAMIWLKENVNVRFEDICVDIQKQLGGDGQTNFRKIWQCYETHFYQETIDVMSRLYEESYSGKIRHVLDNLPFLTAKDLDLSGFILNVLDDVQIMSDFLPADDTVRASMLSHVTVDSATPSGTICAESSGTSNGTHSGDSRPQTPHESLSHSEVASESSTSPIVNCDADLSSQSSAAEEITDSTADVTDVTDVPVEQINSNVSTSVFTELCDTEQMIGSRKSSEQNIIEQEKEFHDVITVMDTNCNKTDSVNIDQVDQSVHSVNRIPPVVCQSEISHIDKPNPPTRPTSIFQSTSAKDTFDNDSEVGKSNVLSGMSVQSSSGSSSRSATLSSTDGLGSVSSSSDLYSTDRDSEEPAQKMTRSFITISQPMLTTLTWERPVGEESAYHVQYSNVPMSPMALSRGKSTQFQAEHRKRFHTAFSMLDQSLQNSSPLYKLQSLYKCLRELSEQYEQLQLMFIGKSAKPCADDLIDILSLFLCNFDTDKAQTLYAHIMMLSDLMPRFFAGGQFSFTLVQFFAAFQVLKERNLMKTAKMQNESNI